ncbi:MAG: hypothetical protein J0H59_03535 [Comamonadaceae bacterium]|nr:hypothetical protein [Comamonadaceae bacterium]
MVKRLLDKRWQLSILIFGTPLLRAREFQELPPKRTHGTHAGYCAAFQQIAFKPAGAPARQKKAIFKNRKIPFISTS